MYRCFKKCFISMLKYYLLILIPVFIFSLYYILNYVPITISKTEPSKINISHYVPNMYSSVLTYINSPNEYDVSFYSKKILKAYKLTIDDDYKKLFHVYNYDGKSEGALTYVCSIDVEDSSITALSTNSLNENTTPDEVHLSNTPKWTISETQKAYLTDKNLTVNTTYGKFNNCLEVIIITELENGSKQYNTKYIAPILGCVLEKSGSSIKNQKKICELHSYTLPKKKLTTIDEVDRFVSESLPFSTTPLTTNTYKDKALGISLKFPKEWIGHIKIDNTLWADNIEHSTTFILDSNNELYQKIFSIHMLKKGYDKEYVAKNSDFKYIGEYNGKSLVYSKANYFTTEVWYDNSINNTINKMIDETNNIISSIEKL